MNYLPLFSLETWILLITFISLFVMSVSIIESFSLGTLTLLITCPENVLNPCRYGKATHGIFEKLGIPGSKPVMYFGTVGKHNRVCILIVVVLTL